MHKIHRRPFITLRASCGAVYRNRSCLFVCLWVGGCAGVFVCVCVGWVGLLLLIRAGFKPITVQLCEILSKSVSNTKHKIVHTNCIFVS